MLGWMCLCCPGYSWGFEMGLSLFQSIVLHSNTMLNLKRNRPRDLTHKGSRSSVGIHAVSAEIFHAVWPTPVAYDLQKPKETIVYVESACDTTVYSTFTEINALTQVLHVSKTYCNESCVYLETSCNKIVCDLWRQFSSKLWVCKAAILIPFMAGNFTSRFSRWF
jgi:hypothetical protein